MGKKIKIYIASGLGFSEAGRLFLYEKIVPAFNKAGLTFFDPWTSTPDDIISSLNDLPYGLEKKERWKSVNSIIGFNNEKAIKQSGGVFAVLDGTDVDSGTAAEIGFASGIGKKILGYRNDFRLASDNEGCLINLQVEYFISLSGGKIITNIETLDVELRNFFG